MARFTPRTTEREIRSALVGHKRERVLGRVGRAVDAVARDFAREAAQLENGGVGEKPPPNVSWSSRLKLLRLTKKDRVVVETAMRLDVAVAVLLVEVLAGLPARGAHVRWIF